MVGAKTGSVQSQMCQLKSDCRRLRLSCLRGRLRCWRTTLQHRTQRPQRWKGFWAAGRRGLRTSSEWRVALLQSRREGDGYSPLCTTTHA